MSYTASYVILAVILVRLLLKKAPKSFSYALWSVVLFRLICPWSFESAFSLLSIGGRTTEQFQPFPEQFVTLGTVRSHVDTNGGGMIPSSVSPAPKEPLFENIFTLIWLIGIAALLIYSVVMLLKLKKQLKGAVHDTENIYLSANLATPFVMRAVWPRIYLPLSLSETEKHYIMLHEQTHIRRFDHLIKLVSFLVLCIHWFNPLAWVAFFLSGRDMEMSCDETVIKKLGSEVKKEYSSSLLSLATGRRMIGGIPLAFGEGDTKSRIQNVLNYKKLPFWIAVEAIVLCGVLIVGLMANPHSKEIIMVNDTLYEKSGETVSELPLNTFEIGVLGSILHTASSMPEHNFQGAGLDEKYAGNRIFQSGPDDDIIYLEDFEGFFIAFEAQSPPAWRSTVVAVSFPAHSENESFAGKTEPFAAKFLLPNGWEVRQPNANSDQGVGYFSSNFLIEMHLYHDDLFVGQIGFNGFEPYEGEVPAEDYYKTVYSVLRLGSMYTWDAYTPVNTTETFEAAVATVSYLNETEVEKHPGAMPDVPVTEVPGVLAYDKNLKVYMGIQFIRDVVTQQQAEQIASSVRFTAASEQSTPAAQSSAGLEQQTEITFFVKPDEPAQVIGETAANIWLKSYMGENVSPTERIADYTINAVTVIAGDPNEGQRWSDMAYQYVVRVDYDITTASEEYFAPGDGASGKGMFQGLFRELCVKALGNSNFEIVSIGTGGGEQEFATQEERVYFRNLPTDQEALYQRLAQRGLREWQIHTLTNTGFNFEEMLQLSDGEITKILAPGSSFMGDTMSEDEFYKLVDSGIAENDIYILQSLGYDYDSIVSLTPEQMDFIFPNTELVDNLVALGYDRNMVEVSGFLYEGGWETYKELLDEVFKAHP
ncbi:M56 family metallopeptidase [Oscillospiraceae bacterium LTW-04]|nr:M56 family metallopeptidase [Oscillospiraceae bacterium MB24-C1]